LDPRFRGDDKNYFMDKLLVKIKKLIPKKIFKALQPAYHFFISWLSAVVYRHPSEHLIVIGITGTTGKTTSVYLMAKMLEEAGLKVGYTSTAMFNNGQKEWLNDKKMTMVGRFFTQKILRQMVKNNCQFAIVETTSEGVRQFRHRFINYDTLIFTGLYPEHIESHGGFENYKQAKGKLFAHLKKCKIKYVDSHKKIANISANLKKLNFTRVKKTIIVNGSDKYADYFLNFWAEEKMQYCLEGERIVNKDIKTIKYNKVNVESKGINFIVEDKQISLQLLGAFNAANAMNAICFGLSFKLSLEKIKSGLEKIKGVAGRLESINEGQNFTVIVDYAFEPNAVSKLFETVKLIPHNRIIHVLGSAGGGRDIARRPILGKLAGKNADLVIITNEDPYDEDPNIIIDQVALGAEQAGKKLNENLFKILDRYEAIKKAIETAENNDVVLITGKGSEQAICVANGEKITWDDRAVVRGILNNKVR
jgi:UDP-N-acetylmuramoyl-L-alanyl-D-glutamate--2,6-diaminopimelate ligase